MGNPPRRGQLTRSTPAASWNGAWTQPAAVSSSTSCPLYSPNENKTERPWLDLHAKVTRKHRCRSLPELMSRLLPALPREEAARLG